jgi:hypothetical protein
MTNQLELTLTNQQFNLILFLVLLSNKLATRSGPHVRMVTLLVRLLTGEIRKCNNVTEQTTLDEVLERVGCQKRYGLVKVERDIFGLVIDSSQLSLCDSAFPYCKTSVPTDDDEPECLDEPNHLTHADYKSIFRECNLWITDPKCRVRVFFNSYTRMILGLPMWYLDIYVDEQSTTAHLNHCVRSALDIQPNDHRFSLFGNYRSHVSVIDMTRNVLETTREEDPEGDKFWQFMMRPECEDQANLGISRQSALAISESSKIIGNRKYWFVLQGTTLFYFKNPRDRTWRKAIEGVDQCRTVYRGSNHQKTLYTIELTDPAGKIYRLASHSKRRIEKWMTCIQSCHRSLEINEPLNMSMISKLTAPQPTPPIFDNVKEQKKSNHRHQVAINSKDQDITVTTPEKGLLEVEKLLKKIELGANTLSTRQKLRRKEAFIWVEAIRAYMIAILRVDRPGYALDVVPEIKTLVVEVKNFAAVADGQSEFVLTQSRSGDFIELIMDSVNCLFSLYRDAVTIGGGWDSQNGETVHQRENQMALVKLRRALKRPMMRVRLDKVPPVKPENDLPNDGTKIKWWSRLTTKTKATIPAEEAQDMSKDHVDDPEGVETPLDTPLETPTVAEQKKKSLWNFRWSRNLRNDEISCTSGDGTPRTPRASRSVWRFLSTLASHQTVDTSQDQAGVECDDLDYDAEIEDGCLPSRRLRHGPRMIIDETGASMDTHSKAAPSTPLKSCHHAQDSLDHHRNAKSLRPIRPITAGTSSPKGVDDSRTLLKTLMKHRMSDSESGGVSPASSPLACHVCNVPVHPGEDVHRTPFSIFHLACLTCDECGHALSSQSFRMENGKPLCRNGCPETTSPRLKSILKRVSNVGRTSQ